MSPYFKEHIYRQIKNKTYELLIALFIFIIFLVIYYLGTPRALEIFSLASPLFLMTVAINRRKALYRNPFDYRGAEAFMLPLSMKEYFWQEFIVIALQSFVGFVVGFIVYVGILNNNLNNNLLINLNWVVLFYFSIIAMINHGTLMIRFKNASFKQVLVLWARIILVFGFFLFFNFSFLYLFNLRVNNIDFLISSDLTVILLTIFYLNNIETILMNEHKNYASKNIKWYDVPGFLVMAGVAIVIILSLINPPQRKPASIKKIQQEKTIK